MLRTLGHSFRRICTPNPHNTRKGGWKRTLFLLGLPLLLVFAPSASFTATPKKPTTRQSTQASASPPPQSRPAAHQITSLHAQKALSIEVVGVINAATADYIKVGIQRAQKGGYDFLILNLDTPGGYLQATRSIVKSILNAPLPVVVFVTPSGARAGSAGVFITMAGHVAAMSPGTNIGAAHPVTSGGKDPEKTGGKHMAKKIENDTLAFAEAIAKQRQRNVKWARQAVLESDSITSDEALRKKVIDLVALDRKSLLRKLDQRIVKVRDHWVKLHTKKSTITPFAMSTKQHVLNFFADPRVAYFLGIFGLLGIVAEIYSPGMIFPGVLGAICLFLSFVSMQVLPINYGGLVLMGLGVLLLVAEMLTPTFGVLFLGGIISLTVGSIFLIDSPDPSLRLSWSVILPTLSVLTLLLGSMLIAIVRTYRKKPNVGDSAVIGQRVVVKTPLAPEGKVEFEGELWTASAATPLEPGEYAVIVARRGLHFEVKKSL